MTGLVPVALIGPPSWRVALRLVALKHHITPAEIIGRARPSQIVLARQELIHVLVSGGRNWSQTGRLVKRDRTTVRHAFHRYAELASC